MIPYIEEFCETAQTKVLFELTSVCYGDFEDKQLKTLRKSTFSHITAMGAFGLSALGSSHLPFAADLRGYRRGCYIRNGLLEALQSRESATSVGL